MIKFLLKSPTVIFCWMALLGAALTLKAQTTLLDQNFGSSSLPPGWVQEQSAGTAMWSFGVSTNPNASGGTSINGTPMAFFDDNILGGAAPSTARLVSAPFDCSNHATITLDIDLHFRASGYSFFRILVQNGNRYEILKMYTEVNYSGSKFNSFVHQTFDLSPYRGTQTKLVFEYCDLTGQRWWAGIDNVKVVGNGTINDICANATPITIDAACTTQSNANTLFSGDASTCTFNEVSSMWYSFVAPTTGDVTISTNASFNDAIAVFSGACGTLTQIACENANQFGFEPENLYLSGLTAGQTYLVRVSADDRYYGHTTGNLCVSIKQGNTLSAPPVNDVCANATSLTVGNDCLNSTNINALWDGTVPSGNPMAARNIWFKVKAPANGKMTLNTNSDFAETVTIYSGNCNALTEVANTNYGPVMALTGLTPNEWYFVMISGYFGSIDGKMCIETNLNTTTPHQTTCVATQLT
ncbi:MAG: choice-of-anchor J domain-containing protein [Sphingobacteriales bacterium]|nr:choice-of-anchor J domain-containing protein [Sphingobacteriales bacterium]